MTRESQIIMCENWKWSLAGQGKLQKKWELLTYIVYICKWDTGIWQNSKWDPGSEPPNETPYEYTM